MTSRRSSRNVERETVSSSSSSTSARDYTTNGDEQITADHLYDAKWLFNKSLETLVKNVPLNQDLLEADGKVQHMYSMLLKNSDGGHYESLLVAKKGMSELGHASRTA